MKYTHNDSILAMKVIQREEITVTYRLFENEYDCRISYSALVTLDSKNGDKDDYFIPLLADDPVCATVIFERLHKNTVLPIEVEEIYSDGFSDFL